MNLVHKSPKYKDQEPLPVFNTAAEIEVVELSDEDQPLSDDEDELSPHLTFSSRKRGGLIGGTNKELQLLVDNKAEKGLQNTQSPQYIRSFDGSQNTVNLELHISPSTGHAGKPAMVSKITYNRVKSAREKYSHMRLVRKSPKLYKEQEPQPVFSTAVIEVADLTDDDQPPPNAKLTKKVDEKYLVHFNPDEKTKGIINKVRGTYRYALCVIFIIGGVINTLQNLTDEIHDEYNIFLNELDVISYYAHRQVIIIKIIIAILYMKYFRQRKFSMSIHQGQL